MPPAEVDAATRAAAAFHPLRYYPAVHPTAEQLATFNAACTFARDELGLRVAPKFCETWFCRLKDRGAPAGLTYDKRQPVIMLLDAGLTGDDLLGLVWHELKHVADAAAYQRDRIYRTAEELEARAEQFAADAMRAWCALHRPAPAPAPYVPPAGVGR